MRAKPLKYHLWQLPLPRATYRFTIKVHLQLSRRVLRALSKSPGMTVCQVETTGAGI